MPRAAPMLRLTIALMTALALVGSASADVCRGIEAELSAMSRGPAPRERQAALRAAWDAQRLRAHMSSIGCDRQPFLFLGPQPPAECRAYRSQLGQLQTMAQAAYPPSEERRQQLAALLESHRCGAQRQRRSQPLTAGLFDEGAGRRGAYSSIEIDPRQDVDPGQEEAPRPRATIVGKPVCVRLCDGYFFPLQARGAALQDEGDDLCRSLCPGAETKIYFTQGDIEQARSAEGQPYSELENALRYRRRFDAACSCRRLDESPREGATVLNPDGAAAPNAFGILNPDAADVEAPLRGMTPVPGRSEGALFGREPRPKSSPPPEVAVENLVPADRGEMRDVKGRDGVTRTIRVIGITPSPAPGAAAEASAPARAPAQ